jgi:pyruvate dehydrogenase E2 component (dihydrolipoamide acetyltransferase)
MPVEVLMPALSPTMTKGNLVRWLKKEGEHVDAGDVIAEIETDKATMEVETVDEGTLSRILVKEGTADVPVNKLIALILEEGESESDIEKNKDDLSEQVTTTASLDILSPDKTGDYDTVDTNDEDTIIDSEEENLSSRVKITPVAKRLALSKLVDVSSLIGSGPRGRIIKSDILEFISTRAGRESNLSPQVKHSTENLESVSAHGSTGDFTEHTKSEISSIRKVIAERLGFSKKNIPHFYLTIDCKLDSLFSVREKINTIIQSDNIKISVNDFVVRAAALSLKKVPEANTSWQDDHIKQYTHSNISVAVSIPGGLITPIIYCAEQKGLCDISIEMKDLSSRARLGKLRPEEFQGGSFSISNLGMYGIKQFNAIVNPPQACILSVGSGEKRPVISIDSSGKEIIDIATVMSCTLSVDHRVVDGVVASSFLKTFKSLIENPYLML